MEDPKVQRIIDRLKSGIEFGLFDGSQMSSYFRDGEKMSYSDLWKALRIMYNLGNGVHHKTIHDLCPELFAGSFPYRFAKHNWKKKKTEKK